MSTGTHRTWKTTRSTEDTVSQEYDAAYAEAEAAEELAQMVYDRRTELGLTQTALAERAGMQQPAISRIESGGTTPTVPLLKRLARALDADLTIAFAPKTATFEPTAGAAATAEPVDAHPAGPGSAQATPDLLACLVERAGHLPDHGLLIALYYDAHPAPAALPSALLGTLEPPTSWSAVTQLVRSFVIDEGQLRSPTEGQRLAVPLLVAALGRELGLTDESELRRELPERVERLFDDCPAT
jgi:transcriptional regulator with XRE-family HTH domain